MKFERKSGPLGPLGTPLDESAANGTEHGADQSHARKRRHDGGEDEAIPPAHEAGETIEGGTGNSILLGGPGDDVLYGDTAFGPFPPLAPPGPLDVRNLVVAGSGDDTVLAGFGADTVLGGPGDDLIFGIGAGTVSAAGNATFDVLDGPDLLLGGLGRDTVTAGGGADTVLGGAGDDVLSGGFGADLLLGEQGHDIFQYRLLGNLASEPGTGLGEGERDVIADFEQGRDRLDLSGLYNPSAPNPPAPGTPEPVFLGTGAFVAAEGFQVRYDMLEDGRTVVQFASGVRSGDAFVAPAAPRGEIEFLGPYNLIWDDFIL